MLIFDDLDNRKVVGENFQSLLAKTQALRFISPYISSGSWDPKKIFENNSQIKHIDILCDLKNPACNPKTVRELSRDVRISIKYMNNIHAKVYIFDNKVLVSSANFTPNGMDDGLIEAGSIEEDLKSAQKWYNSLWEKAECVPDADDDVAWNILIANWYRARQKRIKELESLPIENNTTHFLDLLKDGKVNNEVIFSFWYQPNNENEYEEECEKYKRILAEKNSLINKLDFDSWNFFDDDWSGENESLSRTFDEYCKEIKLMNSKIFIMVQISKYAKPQKNIINISLAKACGIQEEFSYKGATHHCNVYYDIDTTGECSCDNNEKNKEFIEKLYYAYKNDKKQWDEVFGDYGYASFEMVKKFLKETKVLND